MEGDRLSPREAADAIEGDLRALGTPERAEGEQRYLKSDLDFLGTTVWQTRRAVRAFASAHPDLTHDELIATVEALWSKPVFERRHAAAFLLDASPALVVPQDLPLLERLIRDAKTWALVDVLAGDVVGALLVSHPTAAPRLDPWARDPDFWIRRSALLGWREPLKRGAPLDRFLEYADAMLDEKEFFVRKAIGWVLREVGKTRPQDVSAWLGLRAHRASGVTMREAVKYLDEAARDRLMTAYKAKRRVERS
ncbi:MAG TPA: DNA alkylation repair protein [Cryptosporangiaceae bacterium]|nr:DNA alkylation repair protein [Cryptosporangiaceae bacterium]